VGKAPGSYRLSLQGVGPSGRYGPQLTTDVTVTGVAAPRGSTSDARPLFKGSGPARVG
jgi:hypothetical protein